MNKDRIHGELRYFFRGSSNLIQSDKELRWAIRGFSNFRKRTPKRFHRIKNHSIWISIHKEIKEQN